MKIKRRFWKWVYKKAEENYLEAHREIYPTDLKCPHCNTWFSLSAIDYKHESVEQYDWGDSVKCGKCGGVSHWNLCAAPVALLCNEDGDPI